MWAGVPDGQKGCAHTQGIHENGCACEPREGCECFGCLCLCLTLVLCAGGVVGSTSSVALCATRHVSVLSVCVLCLCVWDLCSASLPGEPANRQVVAMSPCLGRDPWSPGAGLDPSRQAGGSWAGDAGGGGCF